MHHTLYVLTVFVHILCATLWVGGMLFMSLMLVPALRAQRDPSLTARLIRAVGKRYHRWGWGALGLLILTGLGLLHFRGISHAQLASADFWASPFGTTLAWKLSLVLAVVLLSLAHDLGAARNRKAATLLGRLTLLLSVIIVFLGVLLVRGVPW